MSVNNTVRRARCDCGGAAWLPVRNSSIPVRILSGSVNQGAWSTPSTSSNCAPGMWSARYRPPCTGTTGSSRAWMTRVGAVIVGRIGRTSIRNAASIVARAIPGLALMRSNIASWRIDRTDGTQILECRTAAPPRADGAAEFLPAGDLLRRRRVVLTQLGKDARPQLGRVAIDVVPPGEAEVRVRAGEDQRPRSLRSCCREDHGGRAALAHTEDDGLSEADGVHDGLDLGRSIIQRANFRHRVRQPDPGLVEHEDATERGELLHERLEFGQGPGQLDVADERPGEDELDRPVAEHLIRQAEIAARCVRRFRHGIERN